ncbi:unnamed protein product [Penicillium nalgiovense]|nr:unnamed protein product [Penicillium nalgiovense]
MTGGVYEPLTIRITRFYPIMTVQFIITGGFITRLWLSEVARCTQRGFFEATAGDRDDLDTTCQHGMNGDHIDEDNYGIWRLSKPDNPTGAGKSRCFVLLNDRGALPTPLAMLLVQSRVQGEEPNQAEIYEAASSRCQKCLIWNRCLVYLDPKHPFLYQTREISRKSHMHWMSLKLQVSQADHVSLSIDVVF